MNDQLWRIQRYSQFDVSLTNTVPLEPMKSLPLTVVFIVSPDRPSSAGQGRRVASLADASYPRPLLSHHQRVCRALSPRELNCDWKDGGQITSMIMQGRIRTGDAMMPHPANHLLCAFGNFFTERPDQTHQIRCAQVICRLSQVQPQLGIKPIKSSAISRRSHPPRIWVRAIAYTCTIKDTLRKRRRESSGRLIWLSYRWFVPIPGHCMCTC